MICQKGGERDSACAATSCASDYIDERDTLRISGGGFLRHKHPGVKGAAAGVGALLSFVLLKEGLSWMYLAALGVMVAGAALVVVGTLVRHHTHPHQHTFTHFHGGYVHTHTITHTHGHDHLGADGIHSHRHPSAVLERELGKT